MKVNLPSLKNKLQSNVCEIIFEKRRPKPGDLLPVWDIMMQSWRMVNMDNCEIVNEISEDNFFEYFNEKIYPMTADEKRNYMGT